jgi:methionyl-tRNA synthetase
VNGMRELSLRGRKFFLTPVCLVPNGRAHLGHIAGPLLKMDVLRRHLERAGAEACMIAMSDVHEAHVLIKAYVEGSSPEEVANRFHGQIVQDLAALDIAYDDLLNPLDPAWSETYETINRNFLDGILRNGNATVRSEPMPILAESNGAGLNGQRWRPRVGDPIVSGWLKGRCPHCEQALVGFFCESCGGHFSPSQMLDPNPAHFPGKLRFEERKSLFLELRQGPSAILEHLTRIRVRSDFIEIAERYLRANGASIRLTVPSPWGIAIDDPEISAGQVIFSYSALLIGCHFVAGERYRQLTRAELNPFSVDSDVTCVLSFGIDNTVPFLVGAVGCALGQDTYKPVDHFLVNYFYDLDGSKFSTSRGHVIWGGDIVTLGNAEVDLARAYLCRRNPEFGKENFRADEFLRFHNELGARLTAGIATAYRAAAGAAAHDEAALRYLDLELRTQSAFLDPDTFDLGGSFSSIERWLERAPAFTATPGAAVTWLTGLSLLAYPILPNVARAVWSLLGLDGEPSLDRLVQDPTPRRIPEQGAPLPAYRGLTRAELNACLPATLRSQT